MDTSKRFAMGGATSKEWLLQLQGYGYGDSRASDSRLFIRIYLSNSRHTGPNVSEDRFCSCEGGIPQRRQDHKPAVGEGHLCSGGRRENRPMGIYEHPCI